MSENPTLSRPLVVPKLWDDNERVSAKKLNEPVRAVQRLMNGVAPSRQLPANPIASSEQYPERVRVVLTDASALLSGLSAIDSITPIAGDLVLVYQGTTKDGVYTASAGAWSRIARLNSTDGNDNAPVLPPGFVVAVYDGAASPVEYMVDTGIGTGGADSSVNMSQAQVLTRASFL